jgi:pimeloyl-ACP methyl ester carboxylesterase
MRNQNQWLFELPIIAASSANQENYSDLELESHSINDSSLQEQEWETLGILRLPGRKENSPPRNTQINQRFTNQSKSRSIQIGQPQSQPRFSKQKDINLPIFTPTISRVLTYTKKDVIDTRISLPAQHSLVRLSKNPATSSDAVEMLEAVKMGILAGISCVNWEKAALRAKKLGQAWWTVIPPGEDAALLLDPANLMAGAPLLVFRRELDPDCGLLQGEKRFPASPQRLDAALLKSWEKFKLAQAGGLTQCTSTGTKQAERKTSTPGSLPEVLEKIFVPPLCYATDSPYKKTSGGGGTVIPVIIVPGLMGSRLENENGKLVWNPVPRIPVPKVPVLPNIACSLGFGPFAANFDSLMNSVALFPREQHDIPASGSVWSPGCPDEFIKASAIPHFGNLVFNFYNRLAFDLNDSAWQIELGGQSIKVYACGYDWRQDNAKSAERLRLVVEQAKRETESGKVIIIAHSMGGLVSRYYCKELGGESNVMGLFLLGSPTHGAPEAYRMLKDGASTLFMFDQIATLFPEKSPKSLMLLMRSFPSSYQLLPSDHYCKNHHSWLLRDKNETWYSTPNRLSAKELYEDAEMGFLDGYQAELPPLLVSKALSLRRIFDDKLFSGTSCYMPKNTFIVYSDGFDSTELEYCLGKRKPITKFVDRSKYKVSLSKPGLGDKSVPVFSARASSCLVRERVKFPKVNHGDLPNDPDVINYIKEKIKSLISGVVPTPAPSPLRIYSRK